MEPTHRDVNPETLIIPAVIASKSASWNDETRKVAASDAQRVLEALVAEFGIERAVTALDNQGFRGEAYKYVLKPLHQEDRRPPEGEIDTWLFLASRLGFSRF
jgi:hypothetical protein